jgi:hypothetical protein
MRLGSEEYWRIDRSGSSSVRTFDGM